VPSERSTKNFRKRRTGGPLPIATLVPKLTRKALGKYGFSYAGLITEWETIVGANIARASTPEKLTFPHNKRDSGVLRLRAESGAALEIQHLEPQILERINSYFGYRAVARLQLINGPVQRESTRPIAKQKPTRKTTTPPPKVTEPKLRNVLQRLGQSIQMRESRGRKS
tara:strand:+ start:493 stop:999 length:507 start_codon:yes stop_codon:yes gene_type:complete